MIRKNIKGSITIEASFVIPVVLGVIVFVIVAGFYMHDKCVAFGNLGENASVDVMQVRNFGVSKGQYTGNKLSQKIKDKTINLENIDCYDNVNSRSVSTQIKFSSHFDKFLGINQVLSNSGTRTYLEVQFDVPNPEENIRKTIAIKNKVERKE